MKFILFKRTENGFKQVSSAWLLAAVIPLAFTGVVAGFALFNLMTPNAQASVQLLESSEYEAAMLDLGASLGEQLEVAQSELVETQQNVNNQLGVMASRVAELQARLARMELAARHIADEQPKVAAMLDFDAPLPVGGPGVVADVAIGDVQQQLELLDARLQNRERQLAVLQNLVVGNDVAARMAPAGRPIVEGWLSSPFGNRKDPFTGKQTWHAGIDFAGAEGGDIIAVADGVVSFSGRRHGYGLLVEIQHADGLATRYAHNRENLVSVGDQVVAGEIIVRMGSTGRSTGPHVHFELLQDGKKINPWKVIARAR